MSEYVVELPESGAADECIRVIGCEKKLYGYELREEIVRCRDCKHGHITVNGESCKWCDLIATHDPGGCEPYNGYDPVPYFDADFFCAWGKRKEAKR